MRLKRSGRYDTSGHYIFTSACNANSGSGKNYQLWARRCDIQIQKGISYDECHSRILGEWYLMTNWRAENGVCFKGAAHDFIDFTALKYEFETTDRINEEACEIIDDQN